MGILQRKFFIPFNYSRIPLASLRLLVVVVGGTGNKQKTHKKTCYRQISGLGPCKNFSSSFLKEVQCFGISAQGISLRWHVDSHIHSIIHDSQKTDEWLNKMCIHIYNGMCYSAIKRMLTWIHATA